MLIISFSEEYMYILVGSLVLKTGTTLKYIFFTNLYIIKDMTDHLIIDNRVP